MKLTKRVFMAVLSAAVLAALACLVLDEAGLMVDFGPEMCINVFNGQTGRGYLMGYCSWIGRTAVWMWGGL